MPKQTRADFSMYIFGSAKDIFPEQTSVLSTYEDVIRCFQSVRLQLKGNGSKQPASRDVANIVPTKIEAVWKKASQPSVVHKRVVDMILQYNNKYQTIIKPFKGRKTKKCKHLKMKPVGCSIFVPVNVKTDNCVSVTRIRKYQI